MGEEVGAWRCEGALFSAAVRSARRSGGADEIFVGSADKLIATKENGVAIGCAVGEGTSNERVVE